jgi:hypothetical protein
MNRGFSNGDMECVWLDTAFTRTGSTVLLSAIAALRLRAQKGGSHD